MTIGSSSRPRLLQCLKQTKQVDTRWRMLPLQLSSSPRCGSKSGGGPARIGPPRGQRASTSTREAQTRILCVRRFPTHASCTRRRMGAFVVSLRAVLQPVEIAIAVFVFHVFMALLGFWDLLPDVLQHADVRFERFRQRSPLKRSDSVTLFNARHLQNRVGEFGSAASSVLQRKQIVCLGYGARNDGLCVMLLVVTMFFFYSLLHQLHLFLFFRSFCRPLPLPPCFFLLPPSSFLYLFPHLFPLSPITFFPRIISSLFVVWSSCFFLNCSLPRCLFLSFSFRCVLHALAFRVVLFQARFLCGSFVF